MNSGTRSLSSLQAAGSGPILSGPTALGCAGLVITSLPDMGGRVRLYNKDEDMSEGHIKWIL